MAIINSKPPNAPWRNFYGRLKGKALRPNQKALLDEALPALSLEQVSWEQNPERCTLELDTISGGRTVWLEIGFGGGEHLVHQGKANPHIFFIGAEPYINAIAMLLGKIRKCGMENIAIHPGDARDLFDVLPKASLGRVFLLYPDPWPKKRHHRRRFVTPEHLDALSACMCKGAELRIASDISDYIRQALEEAPKAGLLWQAEAPKDWREPWLDWPSTRYEQKALREGRVPTYLTFRKP